MLDSIQINADFGFYNTISNLLLQQVIKDAGIGAESVVPRQLWMPSSGTKRKSSPGFTLVGDAAHLMTPFAGQGVGIEMKDTHILAKEITTTSNALAAAVSRCE